MDKTSDSKGRVGYRKPPKRTQFKPGQSGNLKGRPRKKTTVEDDVERELLSPVIVVEDGKRSKMTKRRAIIKRHVNKALGGDVKSTELLINTWGQGRSDQRENIAPLLDELRERNRHLTAIDAGE